MPHAAEQLSLRAAIRESVSLMEEPAWCKEEPLYCNWDPTQLNKPIFKKGKKEKKVMILREKRRGGSVQFSSVAQLCLTLCDPMDASTPGLPVHHQLPQFTQTHVHRELDWEESWALKNWCSWTVVLEKTLESSLDCKEIQPVHSEGDQPWDFFVGNDAKAETPVLWPPHTKSWLIGKDSDAGKDWGQEEKGMTEDEMAGWHHWLDGREFEWTPGVGDGQGGLACCDSWGHKESETTERVIWSDYILCIKITTYKGKEKESEREK